MQQLESRSARRMKAGATIETNATGGSFYPHYTQSRPKFQALFARLLMRLAVALVNAGDALAGLALRWEVAR
jgi:hypothetical protein